MKRKKRNRRKSQKGLTPSFVCTQVSSSLDRVKEKEREKEKEKKKEKEKEKKEKEKGKRKKKKKKMKKKKKKKKERLIDSCDMRNVKRQKRETVNEKLGRITIDRGRKIKISHFCLFCSSLIDAVWPGCCCGCSFFLSTLGRFFNT